MPFIETSTGARLHYEDIRPDQPNGETVVAIHGMLGTARYELMAVMTWLAGKGYRVLGPTMRGYGQSTPKPRDFPLDFYHRDARDVLAFLDALGVDDVHILGYSDGGEIALVCAGLQPQRFRSVITWGAVGYFGPEMRAAGQRLYPATWIEQEKLQLHGIEDADAFVLRWIRATKHMIDSGGESILNLAPNIDCPVLLMLGDQDTLNPPEYARIYLDKVRDGRLIMFECGHGVHDEQPDALKRAIEAHLDRAR